MSFHICGIMIFSTCLDVIIMLFCPYTICSTYHIHRHCSSSWSYPAPARSAPHLFLTFGAYSHYNAPQTLSSLLFIYLRITDARYLDCFHYIPSSHHGQAGRQAQTRGYKRSPYKMIYSNNMPIVTAHNDGTQNKNKNIVIL